MSDAFKLITIDIKKAKKEKLIELILNHLSDLKRTIQVYQPIQTRTVIDEIFGRYVIIKDPIYASKLLNYILYHLQVLVDKARKYNLLSDIHEHYYYKARGAIKQLLERIDFFEQQILTGQHGELEIIKLLGYIESCVVSLAGLQELIDEYEEKEKISTLEQKFRQLLDIEKKEFLSRIIEPQLIRALPSDVLKTIRDTAIQVVGLDPDSIFQAIQKLSPGERIQLITQVLKILSPIEAKEIIDALDQLTKADISDVLTKAVRKSKKKEDSEDEE